MSAQFTDEDLIAKHLEIKEHQKKRETVWKEENASLARMLQAIEGILNARILAKGSEANSISTPSGTAFQRVLTFVRVSDKGALAAYVAETNELDFIDWEVTREGVEKFMKAHDGHTPPGVTVTKIRQTITRT